MPVRRIPRYGAQKNIGKFSSVKTGLVAWYESLLERDKMYLLDFDPLVTFWREQPLKIRYVLNGKTHFYTPDLGGIIELRQKANQLRSSPRPGGQWQVGLTLFE